MVGISEELAIVAEGLRLSTVRVRSGEGGGTGVIWGSVGTVVTNAHVIRGGDAIVELWDGRRVQGRLTHNDRYRDLAVLRVDAPNLPSAVIRDSHDVRPGELVVAVGNPLGSRQAVSVGVVHTVGPLAGAGSNRWVQSDVHLQPGNSGGPLADARGRVVGINSMIAHGLALSAPAHEVDEFLANPYAGAWLGITTRPVHVRLDGQIIQAMAILDVEARSAAARAGLRVGDILLSADGLTFTAPDDLPRRLSGMAPGSALLIDLLRNRRRLTVVATVGRPALRPEAA